MLIALRAAAWLATATWTGLLLARGKFWDAAADRLAEPTAAPAPAVEAVVPARNEADVIGDVLAALLAQRYAGPFHVTLVDDRSDDGTAAAAAAAARRSPRFRAIAAPERPEGWSGKVWALAQGVAAVRLSETAPVFWWFTDADVVHAPDTLARLVATAEQRERALVSEMVELHCEGPWEQLLIPAFVFFFQLLYPFAWVNDDRRRTAGAAGGSVLLRDDALRRIGGLERIRGALIDDCSLAAAVKADGGGLWLSLSTRSRSIRPYGGLEAIWSMVARTAYTQLRYSPLLLAGTVAGMLWLYVLPPAATLAGARTRRPGLALAGGAGWAVMALAYAPMTRRYGRPWWEALLLPAAAALYTAMTVDSARRHRLRRGGAWKGRTFRPSGGEAPRDPA